MLAGMTHVGEKPVIDRWISIAAFQRAEAFRIGLVRPEFQRAEPSINTEYLGRVALALQCLRHRQR